jgi:hypothetical protein
MCSLLRWLFLCSFGFLSLQISAQSISRSAIGVTGVNIQNNQTTLQSIVGQSSLTVNRHGFIQPNHIPVTKPSRSLFLSPNPTRSVSYLSGVVKGDMISIIDAKGNIVESFLATSFTNQEIPLQEYPNGVYVIRVFGAFEYQPIKLVKAD